MLRRFVRDLLPGALPAAEGTMVGMGVPERQTDEVLLPLLSAPGPAEADALVTRILEDHAEPVLRDVIWRRLHVFLGSSSDLDRTRDDSATRTSRS